MQKCSKLWAKRVDWTITAQFVVHAHHRIMDCLGDVTVWFWYCICGRRSWDCGYRSGFCGASYAPTLLPVSPFWLSSRFKSGLGQHQWKRRQSGANRPALPKFWPVTISPWFSPIQPLLQPEVINLTAKNLIRFDIEVRIALEADIESARAIILDILANTKEVLERPAPTATVDKIGDFGVFLSCDFGSIRHTCLECHLSKKIYANKSK